MEPLPSRVSGEPPLPPGSIAGAADVDAAAAGMEGSTELCTNKSGAGRFLKVPGVDLNLPGCSTSCPTVFLRLLFRGAAGPVSSRFGPELALTSAEDLLLREAAGPPVDPSSSSTFSPLPGVFLGVAALGEAGLADLLFAAT